MTLQGLFTPPYSSHWGDVLYDHDPSSPQSLTHAVKIKKQPKIGLLASWLALLLPFLTLCRTALLPLASLEHHPTVSPSLATLVLSQSNKSLAANPAQNQTVGLDTSYYNYDIPYTSRLVSIASDTTRALDQVSFHGVIVTAMEQLNRHIVRHGDGPVQPQDDPYRVMYRGCSSTTETDRKDDGSPWLTYQVLLETFIGLRAVLYDERRYFVTGFSTSDQNGTYFGMGDIKPAAHAARPALLSRKMEK